MAKTCSNCKWFEEDEDNGSGFCHRYPPIQTPEPDMDFPSDVVLIAKRAHLLKDDWCGEWKRQHG